MAERVFVPDPERSGVAVGPHPDSPYSSSAVAAADRLAWRRNRWIGGSATAAGLVTRFAALSMLGWLGSPVQASLSGSGPFPPPPVRDVIIGNGTMWSIPVGYYQYESFPLTHPAQLSGAFASNGPVRAHVMDSLQYVSWTLSGGFPNGQEYDSGNVTYGQFDRSIGPDNRGYVVVENTAPGTAEVSWSTPCVAVYTP